MQMPALKVAFEGFVTDSTTAPTDSPVTLFAKRHMAAQHEEGCYYVLIEKCSCLQRNIKR